MQDIKTLKETVTDAVDNMKEGLARNDGILFFASEQSAYPDLIQIDPVIKPTEKILFNVLWKHARNLNGAGLLPNYRSL